MLAGVTLHNFLLIGFLSVTLFTIAFKWVAMRARYAGRASATSPRTSDAEARPAARCSTGSRPTSPPS
jgi:hypothetical protein